MTATLEKYINGRTIEKRSETPAQAKLEKGSWMAGEYLGSKTFEYQGKPTTAYTFRLDAFDGATFEKKGEEVEVKEGEVVSVFGAYLKDKLTDSDIGLTVIIGSEGLGEKKAGKNPAKILTVCVIRA